MPKINWAPEDENDALTTEDIEGAETNNSYAGEIPPGGVYRFKIGRLKFSKATTGTKGLNGRYVLDGSWKPNHKKFEGCPLWDTVWMTKGSAAFVKAFTQALGVSAADLLNKVIVDEDGWVTKIGRKEIKQDEIEVYVAVKRGEYEGVPRLEKAGTGFQVVESDEGGDEDKDDETDESKSSKTEGKSKTGKKDKGKGKSKNPDDEPPF